MSLALSGFWDITRAVTFVFYPGLFSQLCSESSYTSVLCPRPPWCCYLSSGACLTTVVWPLIRTVFNQWYPNQQFVVKTWDPHSLYLFNLINFSFTLSHCQNIMKIWKWQKRLLGVLSMQCWVCAFDWLSIDWYIF